MNNTDISQSAIVWAVWYLKCEMERLYPMPKNYTLNILLDAGAYVLDVNVDPNTCFDDRFKAWCNDENEMLLIDGWNVAIIEKD